MCGYCRPVPSTLHHQQKQGVRDWVAGAAGPGAAAAVTNFESVDEDDGGGGGEADSAEAGGE
jgi:hypothetical protein